jgi:predicted metalloprotease
MPTPFRSVNAANGSAHAALILCADTRSMSQPLRRRLRGLALHAALTTTLLVSMAPLDGRAAAQSTSAEQLTPVGTSEQTYGSFVTTVMGDLDRFWATELRNVYDRPYRPLQAVHPAGPEALPPRCGGRVTYRDVAGNAFYCPSADYIAFDDTGLFPSLHRRFGDVAVGMVLAHEVGHAIQARTRTRLPSVLAELQADCFAGVWLRRYVDGVIDGLTAAPGATDDAVGAALSFRDRPGRGAATPNAHGNGFDRVSALQLGFDEGTRRCARFGTDPPPVTASSFRSESDAATGGDLPFADTLRLTADAVGRFFQGLHPALTPEAIDDQAVRAAYQRIGDVGASMVAVRKVSAEVERITRRSEASPAAAELRTTCIAGAWLGAADRGELGSEGQPISLSPGDLDEAVIQTVVADAVSPAFDRVRALRNGWAAKGTAATALDVCRRF